MASMHSDWMSIASSRLASTGLFIMSFIIPNSNFGEGTKAGGHRLQVVTSWSIYSFFTSAIVYSYFVNVAQIVPRLNFFTPPSTPSVVLYCLCKYLAFFFHLWLCSHRRLQSCVGTQARPGHIDAQLQKAYFVTTLYAIRTSVHAYAICWWLHAFDRVWSSWYEYTWFEMTQAMPGLFQACRRLCYTTCTVFHNPPMHTPSWWNGEPRNEARKLLLCHSHLL